MFFFNIDDIYLFLKINTTTSTKNKKELLLKQETISIENIKRILNVAELSELLGVSKNFIYDRINDKAVKCYKDNSCIYFKSDEIFYIINN